MAKDQKVILVDICDQQIGIEDKLKAHKNGSKLHRAFSIFIFNKKGETLLQQRAATKYHAPLLWANTCCSHQFPGEETLAAAHRRLMEELGIDCKLKEVFSFIYKAPVGNELTEWEYDHVLFGYTDKNPEINRAEVKACKWITLEKLSEDLRRHPQKYAPWSMIALERVMKEYKEHSKN